MRRGHRILASLPAPPLSILRDPCPPPREPPQHHPSLPVDGRCPDRNPRALVCGLPVGARWSAALRSPVDWTAGVQDHAFPPCCRPPRGGRRVLHRRLQPHLPVPGRPPAARDDADFHPGLPPPAVLHPQGPRPP